MTKKTLITYNHCFMSCALPESAYKEIREAILGIYLKYKDTATAYQWTMSDSIDDKNLKVLYAKYPADYKNDFDKEIETAHALGFELYGDEEKNFWCDSEEDAKKMVNNKYLRIIK